MAISKARYSKHANQKKNKPENVLKIISTFCC